MLDAQEKSTRSLLYKFANILAPLDVALILLMTDLDTVDKLIIPAVLALAILLADFFLEFATKINTKFLITINCALSLGCILLYAQAKGFIDLKTIFRKPNNRTYEYTA